jgi:hypothetical protein
MKLSKGKASPALAGGILERKLKAWDRIYRINKIGTGGF